MSCGVTRQKGVLFMEQIKLGIIGVGNMGTTHVQNILAGKCPEIAPTAGRPAASGPRALCPKPYRSLRRAAI